MALEKAVQLGMPYSTGQQGLPGNYKPMKSEYIKQEQRADIEMKMNVTARQSLETHENIGRVKNEANRVSVNDLNSHHILRKRLHGQVTAVNRTSSSDEVIKVKREN